MILYVARWGSKLWRQKSLTLLFIKVFSHRIDRNFDWIVRNWQTEINWNVPFHTASVWHWYAFKFGVMISRNSINCQCAIIKFRCVRSCRPPNLIPWQFKRHKERASFSKTSLITFLTINNDALSLRRSIQMFKLSYLSLFGAWLHEKWLCFKFFVSTENTQRCKVCLLSIWVHLQLCPKTISIRGVFSIELLWKPQRLTAGNCILCSRTVFM